jgi:transposase
VSEQLADMSAIEAMYQAHDREFDAQQKKAKAARGRLTKKLDKLTEDLRATFDSKNIESMSTLSQARVRKRISIEIDAIEESLDKIPNCRVPDLPYDKHGLEGLLASIPELQPGRECSSVDEETARLNVTFRKLISFHMSLLDWIRYLKVFKLRYLALLHA